MSHRPTPPGCPHFHHPVAGEVIATDGRRTLARLPHHRDGWAVDFTDGLHLEAPTLHEARASVIAHHVGEGE